jgi:hypothetical protein
VTLKVDNYVRDRMTPGVQRRIEMDIPAGHRVTILHGGTTYTARLYRDEEAEPIDAARSVTAEHAAATVLYRYWEHVRPPSVTVKTDADGWVTSIEEAD